MNLSRLRIQNFRGLKNVEIPLSNFGCLIGENNAGKSSVLHALLLVLPGSSTPRRINESDFHDKKIKIRIELEIEEINDSDLKRIKDEANRTSLSNSISNGKLILVKEMYPDLKALQLKVSKLAPIEEKFSDEFLGSIMSGLRGADLREAVVRELPVLASRLQNATTQKLVKDARDEYVAQMPPEELTLRDFPLPTGLDAAIKSFLPEVIYIEAVKDVADEVKTTDSATFGKLLGILLDDVQGEFESIEKDFQEVQRKLSRIIEPDGSVVDERLPQVKVIEKTLESHLRESFPNVDLEVMVPAPTLKTIFGSAGILVDDGVLGSILSKGDGLKRAFAFSILRTYTTLRSQGLAETSGDASLKDLKESEETVARTPYLLLFEEPELYLYPRAQRQLMKALEIFAREHAVLITTHSPIFFDALATQSFIKLKKIESDSGLAPETVVCQVSLTEIGQKNSFQIICHENNEIGFFSKKVVLVEGDSDILALAHLAKVLRREWDARESDVSFAKIGGKGNIQKYREFFAHFDIEVHVICDLDVLINGFDHISRGREDNDLREKLIRCMDSKIAGNGELNSASAQSMSASGNAKALWSAVLAARDSWDGSHEGLKLISDTVAAFFAYAVKSERLEILRSDQGELADYRDALISSLRSGNIHVLKRGTLEDYYPEVLGRSGDKVNLAIKFCSQNENLAALETNLGEKFDSVTSELKDIFTPIFAN